MSKLESNNQRILFTQIHATKKQQEVNKLDLKAHYALSIPGNIGRFLRLAFGRFLYLFALCRLGHIVATSLLESTWEGESALTKWTP